VRGGARARLGPLGCKLEGVLSSAKTCIYGISILLYFCCYQRRWRVRLYGVGVTLNVSRASLMTESFSEASSPQESPQKY